METTKGLRRINAVFASLLAGLALGGVSACQAEKPEAAPRNPAAEAQLLQAGAAPENWVTYGGTYAEQRYSTLRDIADSNVGRLGLAWSFEFDTNRGQEATPLVVDGVMYVTSAWSKVFALDARTGAQLWSFDPKVPGETAVKGCCDVVNRGLAYYDGRVFFAALDGRLIALDAQTGRQVWSVMTVDPTRSYTITGAPRVVKGLVLIGNAGAEFGVRGYVSAYSAADGRKVWRFYTVPGDPRRGPDGEVSDKVLAEKARPTWFGTRWHETGGGGTVWDSIAYDPELDQLYIGVGNGSPWNYQVRSEGRGDNLFLSSIVALKPETGEYLWHYQETPGESWDFTATQSLIQADLTIGGRVRKVLMQAPKNGFFYVLDRTNGQLISARNYVPVNWTSGIDPATGRPIVDPRARYKEGAFLANPGALGGHNWHPMSFSPQTGLVYIPAQEIPLPYQQQSGFAMRAMGQNLGIDLSLWAPPEGKAQLRAVRAAFKGRLIAWDPVRQKEAWRVEYDGPWNGGTLATAGNLVFQGTAEGKFRAFRASTGDSLWSFDAPSGMLGGPITYAIDGVQYVAVLSGFGGAYGISSPVMRARPPVNGRVLVFRLGGEAKLPARPEPPLAPVNVPTETWPAGTVARGRTLFENTCSVCHGFGARSGGILPDLRRSGYLGDRTAWEEVVLRGALKGGGMASFAPILTAQDADAIRSYVADRAKQLASEGGS